MSTLVALAGLRSLARHPWQIALSVLGVALGVAVVVGIDLAGESARRAAELAAESVSGRATHRIEGGAEGVPDELYAGLRLEFPDLALAPVVEELVRTQTQTSRTLTLLGIDPLRESELRPWLAGETSGDGPSLAALMIEPGACLLADSTARELGLAAGDTLEIRCEGRLASLRMVGVLEPADEVSALALAELALVDISTAQELCLRSGNLSRIDLTAPNGERGRERLAQLAARLPPAIRLTSSDALSHEAREMTRALLQNLRASSLLALLVGMFLVYNTMTFSVLRRRELIGTLRALGVSRGQVFRAVWSEAMWIGCVGTALGVVLGTELATGMVQLVSRTINELYFAVSVRSVELEPASLAKGVALGLGATLLSALAPAMEATGSEPRQVQLRSALESRARIRAPRLAWSGVLLLTLASGCFAYRTSRLEPSFAGLFLLMGGAACLTPSALVLASEAIAPLLARPFGLLGRHAARDLAANLSRTSVAAASLSIAIAATVGIGVMVASFRSTVARWLQFSLSSDVYVSAPSQLASHNTSRLDPLLVERIRSAPGVAAISTYRGQELEGPAGTIHFAALDMHPREQGEYRFLQGEPEEIWSAFFQGAAIVSESFAWRHGVGRGGELALPTDGGPRAFPVAGVYYDYASDRGFVLLARSTFERHWHDRGVTSIGVFAEAGVDLDLLAERLRSLVHEDQLVHVRRSGEIQKAALAVFERTFAITEVLRVLTVSVAFIGVLSASMALLLERAREVAVLRAQGLTPRGVVLLALTQSGLLGLISGLLALPLGLAVAVVLTRVIQKRSFGWTLEFEVEPGLLLEALALAVGAALLAGLYPAWRMSRSSPALSLRAD